MRKNIKAAVQSIGCRLNQAEMRSLGWQLEEHGIELVRDASACDLIVINTCTVTAPAAADSRSMIRTALRKNPETRVLVTGCWATMEPEAAEKLAGKRNVISNQNKDGILDLILQEVNFPVQNPAVPSEKPDFHRTRAFIKVQDGCSSRCSYCITTIARGRAVSIPVQSVIESVLREVEYGAREVVLTGVQLNRYGADFDGTNLAGLIEAILGKTDIPRIRLSSLEPWALPTGFFDLWQSPRMCRHLHLPLQSGCNATLKRMRRPYTREQYKCLLEEASAAVPGAAFSSDIITGFPGETDTEFEESLQFVQSLAFASGHVFSYSPRPHTDAASFPDKVTERTIKERTRTMRSVFREKQNRFCRKSLKTVVDVLWEKATPNPDGTWSLSGWSDTYLHIEAPSTLDLSNRISHVELQACGMKIKGRILE